MGQTPAIIVDSSAFNLSGSWATGSPGGYRNTFTELGIGSGAGNLSIKIVSEIIQSILIGSTLQGLPGESSAGVNCTLQRIDMGTETAPLTVSGTDIIKDNIMWIVSTSNMGEVDFSINCPKSGTVFLDYALLTPAPTASLDNQLLFVNYTDSTIVLEGQWQSHGPSGGPGKSSVTAGDTMKFPFTGWNITLLGYFNPSTLGNITLGVSLDEQTQIHLDFNGESQSVDSSSYFEYFTLVQESDSGNHTIAVEILGASLSQRFGFRGFTYNPGFATLNDMPDLSAVSTSISSPTSTPSHGGSGQSSHREPLHGGAIAGVVVGAIAGIFLIELILWAAWQQIRKRKTLSPAQAWAESTSASEESHLPPGQANVTPFEKRYTSDTSPDMHHPRAANAHGITPFTKSYITPSASGPDGDTSQDQEQPDLPGGTVFLPPVEGTAPLSMFPVGPPSHAPSSSGNNDQNGDQTLDQTPPEPDRTDLLLLERLNNLMNAMQHPPAYGQEVSP